MSHINTWGERTQFILTPQGREDTRKLSRTQPCVSPFGWFQSVSFSCNTLQLWVLHLSLSSMGPSSTSSNLKVVLARPQTWGQCPKWGQSWRLRLQICSLAHRQMGWKQSIKWSTLVHKDTLWQSSRVLKMRWYKLFQRPVKHFSSSHKSVVDTDHKQKLAGRCSKPLKSRASHPGGWNPLCV